MLFNSFTFILVFLPFCLLLYYAAAGWRPLAAKGVLVAASLLFYGWWDPACLLLLSASIAFNWTASLGIDRMHRRDTAQRWLLGGSIAVNLLLLGYYKYLYPLLDFLAAYGLHAERAQNSLILPLGISFFTFTQIGYLIDCKAGIVKNKKLLDYLLFVTFFPHLIAGPILHHREMMPQFADAKTYGFQLARLAVGLTVFTLGLAKKVLFADHLAPLVDQAFAHPQSLSVAGAWGAAVSFSLQIYFDFSGYSEMAVGLAFMFGVRFPANFDSPYKARSIIQFWQHWHMTLTRYLTLYLYHPMVLFVLRYRRKRGKMISKAATASFGGFVTLIMLPNFYTMGLAGIWHGAGLQFLVFGLLHATYLTINYGWRIWGQKRTEPRGSLAARFDTIWKTLLTTLAVVVSSIFFRARSVSDAWQLLRSMAGHPSGEPMPADTSPDLVETLLGMLHIDLAPLLAWMQFKAPLTVALGLGIIWFAPNVLQLTGAYQPSLSAIPPSRIHWQPNVRWGVGMGLIAVLCLLALNGTSEFLYFQF